MNDRQWTSLIVVLIVLALGYAWLFRHAEDDAFITFRYSAHLVAGDGPVWNVDQRVEGYTNFLWMCMMALPIALGLDPLLPAVVCSLLFLGLNLWLSYKIAKRLTNSPRQAFWIWLPLLCNHTLLIFATSGLEMSMNGFLWTLVLWQMLPLLSADAAHRWQRYLVLGLSIGSAMLSRPEGGLLALGCIVALVVTHRHKIPWRGLAYALGGIATLVLPWLIWKAVFYGSLLPNTFFVKASSGSLYDGMRYGTVFVASSGIWIPLIALAFSKLSQERPKQPFAIFASCLTFCFWLYSIAVGGDYLEFRLLTPILPIVVMLPLLALQQRVGMRRLFQIAVVSMVALGIFWGQGHGRLFKTWPINAVMHPIPTGARFMSFTEQGKALGTLLDHDPTIRLAIGACGAIPYYSRFYTIDLYGLNEPRAEFRSRLTGLGPGHGQTATIDFIRGKRPHLISLRCDYFATDAPERHYFVEDVDIVKNLGDSIPVSLQDSFQVIELPLGSGYHEVCIYHHRHPRIDALIKNNRLKIYVLEKS